MPISKVISKARPDHPSIDFDVLRAEGVRHLENFATELWTDYNAHDPGITLLELLCYAITDLGYRTRKLPVQDIMADPGKTYKPWLTAAEVLPCSPVTALDFRKLMIDLKGVKNAWIGKGQGEIDLISQGVVLPGLSDDNYNLTLEKTKQFFDDNWKLIFPDKNTQPAIPIDDLFEKIGQKIENLRSMPLIQEYLIAIGQRLDDLAKAEIRKKLVIRPDLYATDSEINFIYTLIDKNPTIKDLPEPPDKIKAVIQKLEEGSFGDYQAFVEGAVSFFAIKYNDDLPGGNSKFKLTDKDIESLINFFLGNFSGSPFFDLPSHKNLTPRAKKVLESIEGKDLDKKLDAILKLFYVETVGDLDEEGIFFSTVMKYFRSQQPYKKFFPYLAEFFWENGQWIVERIAIRSFLSNVFHIDNKTDLEDAIWNHYSLEGSGLEIGKVLEYIFSIKFCELGIWATGFSDPVNYPNSDPLPLSGLYTILLDLDEDIDTRIPNQVNPVIRRVNKALHANRGLCEDYLSIQIVEQRPVAVCLNIEVAPQADEVDIFAEALRRMQEYLSPVPRFRTFAQRLAELKDQGKNYSAENIYNGPLLNNGFLVDEELGDNLPRDEYYHSDLLREVMSVDGIIGLPVLKVKATPEIPAAIFEEKTIYPVYGGNFPGPGATPAGPYCKPVIDLQLSSFQVKKGARTFTMNVQHIEERLLLFRLINAPDPLEPPGGPQWPEGRYRPDLSDYRSLQFDLPATYTVGDNRPSDDATPKRKAQAKQLQAYLAFYDQILASYLAQLGRIRRLLTVDQNAGEPTRVLPLLYELPGLRELVGVDAPFTAEELDWTIVLQGIREDLVSVTEGEGNKDRKNDRVLVKELTETLRQKAGFAGIIELRDGLRRAFAPYSKLTELYAVYIEDYFWAKYTADPHNRYAQMIHDLAESPADQQRRKNQLLDHLIARFGEEFSDYAAVLLRPEAEPEDNPRQQTFFEYLEAKADFLREIAWLAYERNRGYNYRAFNTLENVSDVWNTQNVSGLQKRVVRKLGISNWETRSLIAEPDYRIDIAPGTNNRGMSNYRAALRRRLTGDDPDVNPKEAVPLMISPAYNSPRVAQDKINELYNIIWQAQYYPEEVNLPEKTAYWFRLRSAPGDRYTAVLLKRVETQKKKKEFVKQGDVEKMEVEILLQSEEISLDEAKDRILDEVMPLVRPGSPGKENEGFHIVEHILLRPLEKDDALLQLHLGCVPEETPRDPYSFWITVVAPAETTRFADRDFRAFFEHELRSETPAHIAVRFCYLNLDRMYQFEEAFAVWMFEKAKCSRPTYCRVDEAAKNLVELLNDLDCNCACTEEEPKEACA